MRASSNELALSNPGVTVSRDIGIYTAGVSEPASFRGCKSLTAYRDSVTVYGLACLGESSRLYTSSRRTEPLRARQASLSSSPDGVYAVDEPSSWSIAVGRSAGSKTGPVQYSPVRKRLSIPPLDPSH